MLSANHGGATSELRALTRSMAAANLEDPLDHLYLEIFDIHMKVKNVPAVSLFTTFSYLRVFLSFSRDVLETSFALVYPS